MSVASGTHSQSHSLHEWVTEAFFVDWIFVVWCLYPSTSFLCRETFTSVTPHPHISSTFCTCLPDSPYVALTLCQILCTPRFPTEPGSRRACPAPSPVLLWEWLTPLLFSQVILGHTSTLLHTNMIHHIRAVNKEWNVCVCRHTQAHLCLFLKDRERDREIEMLMISSWQMVEWFSEDWYYCPLTLICCYSNPQHYSKAGLNASTVSLSPTQRRQLSCEMHMTLTSIWINNRKCASFCLFEQHSYSIITGYLICLSWVWDRVVVVS